MTIQPPVILLAFANDRRAIPEGRYLNNLAREAETIKSVLKIPEKLGLCKVEIIQNATLANIESAFNEYKDQVSVFHFAGHSDSFNMLFEDHTQSNKHIDHRSFASYLALQGGLQLVFLNSCISHNHLSAYLELKIPSVIFTNEHIADVTAPDFAIRFYRALANKDSLSKAFNKAEALANGEVSEKLEGQLRAMRNMPGGHRINRSTWEFFPHPEFPSISNWNLPKAADQRLHLLPDLPPDIGFPAHPFKHLQPYERSDARIFWGRERELLQLFALVTAQGAQRIVVLTGSSGSGKTSMLKAGLLPRLEEEFQIVFPTEIAARFEIATNSGQPISLNLQECTAETAIETIQRRAAAVSKDILLVIDQFELVMENAPHFVPLLKQLILIAEAEYPNDLRIKLIVATRNTHLGNLEDQLQDVSTGYATVNLGTISKTDIRKIVNGVGSTDKLQEIYQIQVDEELPRKVAEDFGKNQDSLTAPILQVVLSHLYKNARTANTNLKLPDYEEVDLQDLLLEFIHERIALVYAQERFMHFRKSGMVENILGEYVGILGKPIAKSMDEICSRYPEDIREDIRCIIGFLKSDARLLVDLKVSGRDIPLRDCLIHESLGPLIKHEQDISNLPGPRAFRILQGISDDKQALRLPDYEALRVGQKYAPIPNTLQNEVLQESKKLHSSNIRREKHKKYRKWVGLTFVSIFLFMLILPGQSFLNTYALIYLIILTFIYQYGK